MPSLLAPGSLALLPLLVAIVAMYMLKVRREDRRVPSTLLWRQLTQDPPANAPWRPPRRSLLLLLQLLALAGLILALARPYFLTDEAVGESVIVLIDRSASMAATDVAPSRLEEAKRQLTELLRGTAGTRVTLIAFDDDMEVLAAAESDPAQVVKALAGVEPVPARGRVRDALAFAAALTDGQPDAEIVLASDGNFEPADDLVVAAPVRYLTVGESANNQSLATVSIAQLPGSGSSEAFIQVANYGGEPATRRVETVVDGRLFDVREVSVPASGRASFTVSLPEDVGIVAARLVGTDMLAMDDAAWASIPPAPEARITLVTDGNRYLETALSLLPTVGSVTLVDSVAMDRPFGLSDVTVLDGLRPARTPPGSLLVSGPPESMGPIEVVGELIDPVPAVVDPEHRLAANARLQDTAILSASAVRLEPDWVPVVVAEVEGRLWPLIAEGRFEGRPAVLLAFDLRQSDLPLRPAFPLLMSSALEMLAPASVVGLPSGVAAGEVVEMRLSPRVTGVQIIAPDGGRTELAIDSGLARFVDTAELGAYRVLIATEREREELAFAVNLEADEESDIRPRTGTTIAQADASASSSGSVQGRRELWWLLGAMALGLFCVEWAYDHRTVVERLSTRRSRT